MGVSGRRADFGVAHHRFSRVFWGSGFGEVRGEEVAGASDGDVGQSGVFERAFPAAASGSWIDAGALLRVPDSVVVAPFASASVGSTGVLLLCHGLQASSFSCGRGQTLGQTFRAEIGGLGRETCIGMFSASKTPKAATPSNSKGLRPLSVERMTGIEPA